jgi:surface antigen
MLYPLSHDTGGNPLSKPIRAFIGSVLLATMSLSAASAQAAEGGAIQQLWQCAPFARMFSGIQLFGAAATWWKQAVGKYAQGSRPVEGAVLVFKAIGSMRSGHVATVSRIVSDRVIKVTHANWSIINGHRGQVEKDVTVVDASPANDWSRVRVWYGPLQDVGQTNYPVYGFIYKAAAAVKSAATPAPTAPQTAAISAPPVTIVG